MKATVVLDANTWQIDLGAPIDIAIPLDFYGRQPSAFHLPAARALAFEAASFVGDVRRGGSANCESVWLNPHGNGTHTECVGHIAHERHSVNEALDEALVPALLVTVAPESLAASGESYEGPNEPVDRVITRRALTAAVAKLAPAPALLAALIVRTLPNLESKRRANYSGHNPTFLTNEAMAWIREAGVRHLLVDLPSVDREQDAGALINHRIFWDFQPEGGLAKARRSATITEMIYVPDAVLDGAFMLNIQIPSFVLDAAPSRPLLFAMRPQ
ncbi:MAG: cyclase family protein [Bradymonadaceae bacterium]|nr:cyclase family protein [Lujinxingiaceae bacterium]